MNRSVLCRSLSHLRRACSAQTAALHAGAAALAAKKTTSAAGGVMGLGKGKKKAGKLGAVERSALPVESDPARLVRFVCGSNIHVAGEDVELGADAQYPAWLWALRTGHAPPLEALDPAGKEYWLRVRAAAMRRNNKLRAMRKF